MHHYFIGKLLNQEDSKNLIGTQSYISRKINSKKISNLNIKFAYLGYMDDETFLSLQDKISNIMSALSENVSASKSMYTGFGITGEKTTKKSVSIMYQNDIITKIVVPYLRSYLSPITGESMDYFPHISLTRIDVNNITADIEEFLTTVRIPQNNTFTIDTIDILKGIPKIVRPGPSSKLDDMDMEVRASYALKPL